MIAEDRRHQAHRALWWIFVTLKNLVGRCDDRVLHEALDYAEMLPRYLDSDGDDTARFRRALELLASLHPDFSGAGFMFDDPEHWRF